MFKQLYVMVGIIPHGIAYSMHYGVCIDIPHGYMIMLHDIWYAFSDHMFTFRKKNIPDYWNYTQHSHHLKPVLNIGLYL